MHRLLLLFAVVLTLSISQFSHASGTVLNGGDAVQCGYAEFPPKPGYYSLDYLLTLDPEAPPLYEVKSIEESLQRLNALMKMKLPELHRSFEIFMRNFLNRDMKRTHLWQPAPHGLINIEDENMIAQLPPACRVTHDKVSLIQAVVRQTPAFTRMPAHTVFAFDTEVLKHMKERLPLQLSFLLVHEWLWEFSNHVVTNRMVNRLLHSQDFERMSRDQLVNFFKQISFSAPNAEQIVLYPESCLPNPKNLPRVFSSLQVIDAALGYSRLNCNNQECQSHVSASRQLFDQTFSKPKFIFSADYSFQLNVEIQGRKFTSLQCNVNVSTAEVQCGDLMGASFKLSGTMNPSCMRLVDDNVQVTNIGISRELNVLYFKLNMENSERFR